MAGIDWEDIRRRNPIQQIVGQAVDLKKQGREYKGLCPFHAENTPSFHVVPDKGFYHCFGCGAHGDVVDFITHHQRCTPGEAIAMLDSGGEVREVTDRDREALAQREEAQRIRREMAIRQAHDVWNSSTPADPHHPYLVRKGVEPHTIRQDAKGRLVLPIYDPEGELQSVQYISDDGAKRFATDAPTRQGRMFIGINMGRTILCEGFATGASIYEAIPDQVCVTYALGNMEKVARELHAAGRSIVLASDAGTAEAKMRDLAEELGVPVVVAEKDDFNDQARERGTEQVARVFRDGLKAFAKEQALPKPRLPFIWFENARPNLDANDFVEGLLTSGSMSVIYGPSNCGKTFFVIDLALHVAWGREWRGREVDKGAVVYLSLEGAQGVQNRMTAFSRHHKCGPLPFVSMPKPVNLLNEDADVQDVIQLVEYVAAKTEMPVRMVIVDTLSRAMAGGNENSSEDMTALIGNCDKVRDATGAHVCIVHHSGKDEARGARGHSSLRAATDTEMEIKRDPELTRSVVKVVKQRDLEAADPFAFTLQSINLGNNRRGKAVTSCVVMEQDGACELARGGGLSPQEQDALDVLHDLAFGEETDPETGEISVVTKPVLQTVWKAELVTRETLKGNNDASLKSQFYRLRNSLKNKGKVVQNRQFMMLGVTMGNNGETTSAGHS